MPEDVTEKIIVVLVDKLAIGVLLLCVGYYISRSLEKIKHIYQWSGELLKKRFELIDNMSSSLEILQRIFNEASVRTLVAGEIKFMNELMEANREFTDHRPKALLLLSENAVKAMGEIEAVCINSMKNEILIDIPFYERLELGGGVTIISDENQVKWLNDRREAFETAKENFYSAVNNSFPKELMVSEFK